MAYLEHEKLAAIKSESQIVGEFLEWLQDQVVLCRWIEEPTTRDESGEVIEWGRKGWRPVHKPVEQWLAEFFDVDLVALEDEKRAMLARIREAQACGAA